MNLLAPASYEISAYKIATFVSWYHSIRARTCSVQAVRRLICVGQHGELTKSITKYLYLQV
jgi:hypothetical protein